MHRCQLEDVKAFPEAEARTHRCSKPKRPRTMGGTYDNISLPGTVFAFRTAWSKAPSTTSMAACAHPFCDGRNNSVDFCVFQCVVGRASRAALASATIVAVVTLL